MKWLTNLLTIDVTNWKINFIIPLVLGDMVEVKNMQSIRDESAGPFSKKFTLPKMDKYLFALENATSVRAQFEGETAFKPTLPATISVDGINTNFFQNNKVLNFDIISDIYSRTMVITAGRGENVFQWSISLFTYKLSNVCQTITEDKQQNKDLILTVNTTEGFSKTITAKFNSLQFTSSQQGSIITFTI